MSTLKLNLKRGLDLFYPIVIEKGIFGELQKVILKRHTATRYALITDKTVKKLYGDRLLKHLRSQGFSADLLVFAGGEKNKTMATVEKLGDEMIKKGHDRSSMIIAVGGGIVGDVAGFVAASTMRGISWIDVPTTLLAMVDASIGGKVGVNSTLGKNMYGAFHQPKGVYIDPVFLETLPEDEYKNGLVELIKHALIADRPLFETLEKNSEKIRRRDEDFLTNILIRSLSIKKKIVEQDERENGSRMLLNYGHTFGHAIEKASDHLVKHGLAVAMGIHIMNKFCVQRKGLLDKNEAERIDALFHTIGIATELPKDIQPKELLKIAQRDKKRIGGVDRFVVLKKIGKAEVMTGTLKI